MTRRTVHDSGRSHIIAYGPNAGVTWLAVVQPYLAAGACGYFAGGCCNPVGPRQRPVAGLHFSIQAPEVFSWSRLPMPSMLILRNALRIGMLDVAPQESRSWRPMLDEGVVVLALSSLRFGLANIAIPMKLDAFVFNEDVCNGKATEAKIAPIAQPNYTFLRIKDYLLQNDLLDAVNLSNATPSARNARLVDLGTGKIREHRLGVYLHWIMPRPYRSGAAATKDSTSKRTMDADAADASAPSFRNPPTRWLVLRKLHMNTIQPADAQIKEVDGWVVESDCIREIDTLDDKVDLQVDVSPYIDSSETNSKDPTKMNIDKQAEIFIGKKSPAESWEEDPLASRANLGLLNSSNQLFPDYQPHNGNVFSALDTFSYKDANGVEHTLTDAVADYYVLGWHTAPDDEPFHLNGGTRAERLAELNMTFNGMDELKDWLQDKTDAKVLCHGAMYQVEWHDRWPEEGPNRPKQVPANDFTKKLVLQNPVAVGTTPMDTLLTYIHAHHEGELENDIEQIAMLLRSQSESITDQQAAEDEVQNYNFTAAGGGSHYVLPLDNARPAQPPTDGQKKDLKLLNEAQALVNSLERAQQAVQWDLFAWWWKFVTDTDNQLAPKRGQYEEQSRKLYAKYSSLRDFLTNQRSQVSDYKNKLSLLDLSPKEATLQPFAQARDPSVLVAGAKSGWPEDFLDSLISRLDYQISTFQTPDKSMSETFFLRCVPEALHSTALALVQEFVNNSPPGTVSEMSNTTYTAYPSLYHDQGPPDPKVKYPSDTPWRDRWESTQAWFPLFLEWEAEFFHIEYDKWTLESVTSRMETQPRFRHAIAPADKPLWDNKDVVNDTRVLSGRIVINPQPAFSLKAQIDQLFSSLPEDILNKYLKPEERKKLKAEVSRMPFLSSPLTGFINQLATTMQGNHLKPNIRIPKQPPVPLVAAYADSHNVGLGKDQLEAMGVETDLTPYGSLVPLPQTDYAAFKPVSHGQFRFTRFNVVDKFGQCAPAIDQHPRPTGPPPMYPCVSDFFAPQMFDKLANVAVKPEDDKYCEFTQVPPQINQPSRLNAVFVVPDEDATADNRPAYWRPMREWDDQSPIWGWIVVNYVDNGIQFFLKDGTFYREARVASPDNPHPVAASRRWQPFGRGDGTPGTDQIDRLINEFTDGTDGQKYLENFIALITDSVNQTKASPSAYGQYINALVGKPLALTNIAYSLEMATDARANESSIPNQQGLHTKYRLLPTNSGPAEEIYQFPLKIGDRGRLYDGLVGFFRAHDEPWRPEIGAGNELDLSKLFTYDDKVNKEPRFAEISGSTFPKLQCFYSNPSQYDSQDPNVGENFRFAANAKLNKSVFGCIVDPFLPVHAYMGGGVTPVQPLRLPDWTWQDSLRNMTAFFHFGPLVVTDDVPGFSADHQLPPNYAGKLDTLTVPDSAVQLPSLKLADWRWLQGYTDLGESDTTGRDGDIGDPEEKFMALGLGKLDATPRFQPGPYTAIEGYLQMKSPIQVDEAKLMEK
ncbi:hypothetical protein FH972_023770 [Carpinus fangiana]|uniref:Uncharacterized protein n=1 Tax=Carpinus fangiana TaxID=176857 RepID=A0A5N6KWJ8_9ROSI|nr:hypothetical protein FH972_023770 [Carpinus fangiana]